MKQQTRDVDRFLDSGTFPPYMEEFIRNHFWSPYRISMIGRNDMGYSLVLHPDTPDEDDIRIAMLVEGGTADNEGTKRLRQQSTEVVFVSAERVWEIVEPCLHLDHSVPQRHRLETYLSSEVGTVTITVEQHRVSWTDFAPGMFNP
jgi:hypothetical protein